MPARVTFAGGRVTFVSFSGPPKGASIEGVPATAGIRFGTNGIHYERSTGRSGAA
ncbi:hypothetical protein [Mycobacterium sp. 050134]|uniref:hypothetical protein n=1 Tax=Mycobacterium sp. 050134 TaxID=3096111 RepID=UPI002EDB29A5